MRRVDHAGVIDARVTETLRPRLHRFGRRHAEGEVVETAAVRVERLVGCTAVFDDRHGEASAREAHDARVAGTAVLAKVLLHAEHFAVPTGARVAIAHGDGNVMKGGEIVHGCGSPLPRRADHVATRNTSTGSAKPSSFRVPSDTAVSPMRFATAPSTSTAPVGAALARRAARLTGSPK